MESLNQTIIDDYFHNIFSIPQKRFFYVCSVREWQERIKSNMSFGVTQNELDSAIENKENLIEGNHSVDCYIGVI